MPQREHAYDIVVSGDKVLGQVWWNPEESKIDSDTPKVLQYLKDKSYQGITFHDGVKFLTHLGRMLKNGYVYAKRVDK